MGGERRIYPGFLFQHVDCFDVFSPEDIFAEACSLDSYYLRENNLSWITVKQIKLKFESCDKHSQDRLDFLAWMAGVEREEGIGNWWLRLPLVVRNPVSAI